MGKTRKGLKTFNSDAYLETEMWEIILLVVLFIGMAICIWFLWAHYEDKKENSKQASFSYEKDF